MLRWFLALLAIVPQCAFAAEPKLEVKAEAAPLPAELAAPVRELLAETAAVVKGDIGLSLWYRADIPARAAAEQVKNGLTYREIPVGTLMGAVRFEKPFIDFRKQQIAAGVYTLRFALQPETGDHTGTSPHPEFFLLCPAEKDRSAELIEAKKLYELSADAVGGDHPGVLPLFPAKQAGETPKVEGKGDGIWVVSWKRLVSVEGTQTSLGFAVVVAGHSKD